LIAILIFGNCRIDEHPPSEKGHPDQLLNTASVQVPHKWSGTQLAFSPDREWAMEKAHATSNSWSGFLLEWRSHE